MNQYENIDWMIEDLPPSTWYRINKDVEYSTDFDWFAKHQARLVKSGNKYTFCSRLESKVFKIKSAVLGNNEFSDSELIETWKEIHKEILEGKHGKGKIVY
jgi:hypothetical protein